MVQIMAQTDGNINVRNGQKKEGALQMLFVSPEVK